MIAMVGAGTAAAEDRGASPGSPRITPAPLMAQAGLASPVAFAIPSQPLASALTAFGAAARLQVLYPADLARGLTAPAVSGTMTPEDALRRLLAGSGLIYRFTNADTVTLVKPVSGGALDGAMPLDPVTVQGNQERAWGPARGYVAQRSATGTKTDTPLIETPQSISVVTRQQIEAQGAQTLNQALRYTSAVIPETRGATATRLDQMTVRGFSPAQYLDGLRLPGSRDALPQVDMFRLERIEVLKGPSSVLYGQAPPGGIVAMVSKQPTAARFNEITLQGGTYEDFRGTLDLSGPIDAEGKYRYRLLGSVRDADGQVKHTRERRIFVSPSFAWRPDENTTLTIFGHYQRDPHAGSYGSVPAWGSALRNPLGRIPTNFYDGEARFEKSDREQASIGYAFEHRFDNTWTVWQNFRYIHSNGHYRSLYNASRLNADMRTLWLSAITTKVDIDAVALDNQAQARFTTGPLSHTLLFGLDYRWQGTDTLSGSAANVARIDLFTPSYGKPIATPAFTSDQWQTDRQIGLYLQDQIKFDRWVLLLGGRYDWIKTRSRTKTIATGATSRSGLDDSAFSGRAGLVYLFDSGFAPYVSYTQSFEPQSGFGFGGKPFDPTRGRQYEVGLKYQPPGINSFITLSMFDLVRTNVLTTDPDPTHICGTGRCQMTAGEVRSRGVEIEGKASLADGLNVTASYAYLDNKTTKSNSTTLIDTTIVGVPTVTVPLKGKVPTGIPRHTASLWVDYTVQDGRFAGWGLGGGMRYVGTSWGDSANTFKVSDYVLFDASVSYDFGQLGPRLQGLKATLNVTNLFDKKYVGSCLSYAWCWYGYRRTAIASLRYQW